MNLMFQYCRTFIDRHYGQPTEIVENLYFLQNVNLTKTIRLRIRKAYFLGNKLLLFSMWNVKHISRFRTLWKCRWIWSLPINQMLKTRCFRRVELGGSPRPLVKMIPTEIQLILIQRRCYYPSGTKQNHLS